MKAKPRTPRAPALANPNANKITKSTPKPNANANANANTNQEKAPEAAKPKAMGGTMSKPASKPDSAPPLTKAEQQQAKADYKWPEPLPAWKLVSDTEKNTMPLPGEGQISEKILNLPREGYGILYNAIHRDPAAQRPSKSIVGAIKGAQRMRAAMQERVDQNAEEAAKQPPIRFVLFTERQPMAFMQNEKLCRDLWPECTGFNDAIKVFDLIIYYESLPLPAVIARRERFQTWPELWVKRIMASLHSPFAKTMVVDSDVYGCTNFADLFSTYLADDVDVAATLAPAPFGASRNYNGAFRAGFPESYAKYTERNLGLHILNTGDKKVVQLLALFRDIFIRQANDTEHTSIGNDQCAFREAMWIMRDNFGLQESTIPAEKGCRHETGCADGCLVVHRHQNPEMSRAELKVHKKQQRVQKLAKKEAEKLALATGAEDS